MHVLKNLQLITRETIAYLVAKIKISDMLRTRKAPVVSPGDRSNKLSLFLSFSRFISFARSLYFSLKGGNQVCSTSGRPGDRSRTFLRLRSVAMRSVYTHSRTHLLHTQLSGRHATLRCGTKTQRGTARYDTRPYVTRSLPRDNSHSGKSVYVIALRGVSPFSLATPLSATRRTRRLCTRASTRTRVRTNTGASITSPGNPDAPRRDATPRILASAARLMRTGVWTGCWMRCEGAPEQDGEGRRGDLRARVGRTRSTVTPFPNGDATQPCRIGERSYTRTSISNRLATAKLPRN